MDDRTQHAGRFHCVPPARDERPRLPTGRSHGQKGRQGYALPPLNLVTRCVDYACGVGAGSSVGAGAGASVGVGAGASAGLGAGAGSVVGSGAGAGSSVGAGCSGVLSKNRQRRNKEVGRHSGYNRNLTHDISFPEMNGPPSSGLSLRDVVISNNIIERCAVGAMAAAVLNVGAPGVSFANSIAGLTFEGDRISGGETGILVAGGILTANEVKGVAGIDANNVSGVTIRKNFFDTSKSGILVAGAFAAGKAGGNLTNNRVEIRAIDGN